MTSKGSLPVGDGRSGGTPERILRILARVRRHTRLTNISITVAVIIVR